MTGSTHRPHASAVAAVAVVFAGSGIAMASAVSRMPEIKTQVGASATQLAFALVCLGIGSLIAMPLAGRLTARFGTAVITAIFITIGLLGWSLIPLATSVPQLAGILLLAGIGVGTWDVAMNVQGTIVEQARGQVLMPLWHGLFSVGGVVGALGGAGAARWGLPLGWQLPVVSAALWIAGIASTRAFLPNPVDERVVSGGEANAAGSGDEAAGHAGSGAGAAENAGAGNAEFLPDGSGYDVSAAPRTRHKITRTEVLLGLILLSTALGEGAANDWLAVALVDERGAPAAFGALTYAGFNTTMAIGRFTGGPLIARFGRVASLRAAGLIAAGGVLLLCLVPGTAVALIGAAAWGLGLAIVFPSAVSAAGEIPGRGGRAIATASTVGYGGFLLGAPTIGLLAHVMPLLDALLVIVAFAVLIVVLAPVARERRRAGSTAPDPHP